MIYYPACLYVDQPKMTRHNWAFIRKNANNK